MENITDPKFAGLIKEERERFESVLKEIGEPLTLRGLEKFFESWDTPVNYEEVAEDTAVMLSKLKRDFTAEALQEEAAEINKRVSRYKWDTNRFSDGAEDQGDDYWRRKILNSYLDKVTKQDQQEMSLEAGAARQEKSDDNGKHVRGGGLKAKLAGISDGFSNTNTGKKEYNLFEQMKKGITH